MSPLPTPISSISNYGKACTNCSKAKCKCSYADGKEICERCDRLKKDCRPLAPARKRTARPTNTTSSSTAAKQQRLEQKLDSLVSLLQAQGNVTGPVLPASQVGVDSQSPQWSSQIPNEGATPSTRSTQTSAPNLSTAPTSPLNDENSTIPTVLSENQKALDIFRDESLKFFPFVYFPPHMTASQLAADFPILWLSVSAISSKTLTELFSISEKLQNTILDKIYVQGERSLDLALAILSYVGWFRYQRKQKAFFHMWTQMAASLAIELGLNKPTPGEPGYFCYNWILPSNKQPTAKRERTMLERRVILSAFLMTSWTTMAFRKSDSMKWTSHMDECLHILEKEPEWEGDRMLALQVRCQLITQQIFDSPWCGGPSVDGNKASAPEYFTKSLKMLLQEVRNHLDTFHDQRDIIIRLSVLSTELTIHECSQGLPLDSADHRKLEPFFNALYCIKAWFDLFLSMSDLSCNNVTFPMFSQFTHCLVSLYRLSTLDNPSWDRELVKQTVDVVQITHRFAANVERVRATRPMIIDNDEEDPFTKSSTMMRKLGDAWAGDIAAIGAKQKDQTDLAIAPDLMDLDMFDPQWMTDMFLGGGSLAGIY